jgi:hypothetical protein
VTHPHEIARHYVCGLCNPPARAGKGKLAGSLGVETARAMAAAGIDESAHDARPEMHRSIGATLGH